MLEKLVCWYDLSMVDNLGATRLHSTLKQHFFHPRLASKVHHQIKHCDICQCMNRGSHQYGDLALRDAHATPWQTIAVDCIGPWVIELLRGKEIKLLALTYQQTCLKLTTFQQKHPQNVLLASKMGGCQDTHDPST